MKQYYTPSGKNKTLRQKAQGFRADGAKGFFQARLNGFEYASAYVCVSRFCSGLIRYSAEPELKG